MSEEYKRKAAQAALDYVTEGEVLGVGTGSTVDHFIDLLAARRLRIPGAVSSSQRSTQRLQSAGIPVLELNETGPLAVYIDGADEANALRELIKGGGGALTREKVIAGASRQFVCIVDHSKLVKPLGGFPVPIEVIPMARSFVARELVKKGGRPTLREGFTTDNGNVILDVQGLDLSMPVKLEQTLNDIPGIVTVGIFALRPADVLLCAGPAGIDVIRG